MTSKYLTETEKPAQNHGHMGLIAGEGDFPKLIARAARAADVAVTVIAIRGFASPDLEHDATEIHWVELGQISRILSILKENDIKAVTLAGRVPHSSIFQYRHFDARGLKMLARAINRKADTILGVVTRELGKEGIEVMDSSIFLKSLMPAEGLLTPRRPLTEREAADVQFGMPLAKAIAGLDVGQTIVVKELVVVAVEGLEGTDACITRAGELAGPGCVVIKVSKPQQDMRFDIPIIGRTTLKKMIAAQCSAIAFSAGETLLFDREEVLALATDGNIAMLACHSEK
jgi:hypothetical protein